jgi:ABC-type antimicrobial peptide transport system ATPase subunit
MSKTIVNLTLSVVKADAEEILDRYPHHPYQQAFAAPDLRQKLISYVLSRVPGAYAVVEENRKPEFNSSLRYQCSKEQRQHIDALIHQGIEQILQEDQNWLDCHIPQEANASFAASSWFG